jgi:acetyl-CoA carboxylase biotin carboxyl carrier protein
VGKGGSKKKSGARSAGAPNRLKPKSAGADNAGSDTGSTGFELSELRRLIRLVQRTGIGELEVSSGGRTVRISARAEGSLSVTSTAAPGSTVEGNAAPARSAQTTESDRLQAVTSPMVGTFYRAPAPDADPYVEVGTPIEVGQTVCIVEAMKLMNEIESDVKGRIVQILVENAQPVEFGQKLFLVDPA